MKTTTNINNKKIIIEICSNVFQVNEKRYDHGLTIFFQNRMKRIKEKKS